ncbi:sigma-70 family RNA polymerase sigma factor [Paenibacillus graminis]|uniref:sigma-70 family RNA polymerase sigma factor n=1 Tax=Paenibacillus graminis TaxID=189425 RepID=UPI002DBD150A|nr:sigma-70 family RNA polymerase sigma factor [Paenibacillus graminis]MEC0171150.1 sigma-70 family RNA polymerase sigma factor [Paenibacillus graminis]
MSKPIDYNPYLGYKDDVIRENMKLVHSVAKRYRKRCTTAVSYEDLVSEGTIGLIKAFHKYDPSGFDGKVTRFSTFAVPTIQGEILRFFRERANLVKIPRTIHETAARIGWNEPHSGTPEEIALELDISPKLAARTTHYMNYATVIYLDQPINSDGEAEITGFDQLGESDDLSEIMIDEFLKYLKPTEKKVLQLRMSGKTQSEIGEIIGVSQTHISRLTDKIKQRLRKYMDNPESEEFKMTREVTTRKINTEEAKRLGVRTVLDEIEWYVGEASAGVASISLNSLGMHISKQGAKMLELQPGDFIQVGFNPSQLRLVIRKNETGTKLNKSTGKNGSVATNNKAIGRWILSKNVSRKRYALQFDETTQVHFIQLEAAGREAGTA